MRVASRCWRRKISIPRLRLDQIDPRVRMDAGAAAPAGMPCLDSGQGPSMGLRIVRSIMSQEPQAAWPFGRLPGERGSSGRVGGRQDGIDLRDPDHDGADPARWHGLETLFSAGTLEGDVLHEMLETDFDTPPRDIHALLRRRYSSRYSTLAVESVYEARRRVKDRLRDLLRREEEALERVEAQVQQAPACLADASASYSDVPAYLGASVDESQEFDALEEDILGLAPGDPASRFDPTAWDRLRDQLSDLRSA